jgi:lysophospholipase L1-like esterase
MPGVKNLIRYQQQMAAKAGIAFWNLYDAMGGEGSMAQMVQASQANYDYTHINARGGKVLAQKLFDTLRYGKEQYDKRKKYEQE